MKLFIATLAASLAFPAAASAETWWLVISARNGGIDIESVPMESEEQCEKAGQKIFNSKDLDSPNNVHHSQMIQNVRYICVLGK